MYATTFTIVIWSHIRETSFKYSRYFSFAQWSSWKDCVCKIKNKTCMSSKCDLVKKNLIISFLMWFLQRNWNLLLNGFIGKTIKMTSWKKKLKSGRLEDLWKKLKSVLGQFIFHWYVKNKQFEAYNKMKQLATEENSNTAMIQMDFAENFMFVPGWGCQCTLENK